MPRQCYQEMAWAVSELQHPLSPQVTERRTSPGSPLTKRDEPGHAVVGPGEFVVEQAKEKAQEGVPQVLHSRSREEKPRRTISGGGPNAGLQAAEADEGRVTERAYVSQVDPALPELERTLWLAGA